MSSVAKGIVDEIKGVPDDIFDIGEDIVKGLWNGITGMTSWIKKKIKSFASDLLDSMSDALGIESPSTEFRDKIGRYISEGIGVGITENADAPMSALDKLGDSMLSGDLNGSTINRKLTNTFKATTPASGVESGSLLGKLNDIYERLDRMQIVLDTGTLVGETIDKIDAGLASRQILVARGV
jgi:phage-related protein